jgi:DNA polymerase-1
MIGYEKFWVPVSVDENGAGWYRLHPSLNTTGTATLRWSSSNPNEQNISKKPGFNLRYCFGPLPGREWWASDYNNLELRLSAYQAGELEMIRLFEKPNDAPYFGSYHLMVFDTLHTARLGLDTSDPQYLLKAKKQHAATWYQWTKNGNFAVSYGAMEMSGTADRAYHVEGAQSIVAGRFQKIAELNQRMIHQADEYNFVETMPDRTVDPSKGYPLLAGRTKWGSLRETTPLNYNIQGTACWLMQRAMVKVFDYLRDLPDYHMIMNVHDEIVFDFPKNKRKNLKHIRHIEKLMCSVGDDIGVPLTVGTDYHEKTWAEGVSV